MLERVISGHQTGVDHGAIVAATDLGFETGGWVPRGRKKENGTVPLNFPVKETESDNYAVRTELNVTDSDGTLIIKQGQINGGTGYTVSLVNKHEKPLYILDARERFDLHDVIEWLTKNKIRTLNVAGPRESKNPGIEKRTRTMVFCILRFYQLEELEQQRFIQNLESGPPFR